MITPAYLQKGDQVAIVAPARKVTAEEIQPAVRQLETWGLTVVTGRHLLGAYNQFSGTDPERAEDLQQMLDNDRIRAVFCARGGYGTVRIIDHLDFTRFISHPKWIIGFSDITVLHSHIHSNFGIETLHATMPLYFGHKDTALESFESLRKALFGETISITLPLSPLSRKGSAQGKLVGGNLSMIYSLIGSRSDVDTRGKILLLEDLDEYLYHIDRMMMNLRRIGKLDQLSGIIVGSMTAMRDNQVPFGKSAEEIIAGAVQDLDYPVCFGFPAGHLPDNRAVVLGRKSSLVVGEDINFIQPSHSPKPKIQNPNKFQD